MAQKLLEILLLPLSKKSSVFPHHSESALSSPSPFLLLCESPDGNRNHNYRPSSRINSSSALATLLKSNILPLYPEKALKKKLRAQSPGIWRKQHKISAFGIQRFCKWKRNSLKLTEGHTKRPTARTRAEVSFLRSLWLSCQNLWRHQFCTCARLKFPYRKHLPSMMLLVSTQVLSATFCISKEINVHLHKKWNQTMQSYTTTLVCFGINGDHEAYWFLMSISNLIMCKKS